MGGSISSYRLNAPHAPSAGAGVVFRASVRFPEHSLAEIWEASPAFNAFRGTDWMQAPCADCPRRDRDFGGCRCQALALTGDARATDPACRLSPHHARLAALASAHADAPYAYRRYARGAASGHDRVSSRRMTMC
jgi:radical SAM protein with 4Fe4S-binding SPASM domain